MFRRVIRQLPKTLSLAVIVAVLVGYVPLTALDHLHLHLHHGLHFTHEHAHIGHHQHHPVAPADDNDPKESGEESGMVSAVLSLSDTAQMGSEAIVAAGHAVPVATAAVRASDIRTDAPQHPSWSSRAPPV